MRAFRLLNDSVGNSYFEEGVLPEYLSIPSERFIIQTKIEEYQKHQHPAPRVQYVVTLKGKLRFTTSDGKQFILEPGIILVAKDIHGEGHSWEIIEGEEWHRIYIIPDEKEDDKFVSY
ncbi:hypothetical protein [Flavobacterium sp. N1994]|uniref:hypothetical protein n=1 Tax=Flavobacterium sp. N1994 TaxID=2986827 RepID=UPI002221737D|nr:hypothetical protein [Flavobacterium sp. N1994]